MASLSVYKGALGIDSADEVFEHLISTLKPSNRLWSYFVNWDKVFNNTREIEVHLNTLNYLIGKSDFDKEFEHLLSTVPGIAKALPALVVRDGNNTKNFKILVDYSRKQLTYDDFDFDKENPSSKDIEKYLTFITKTGLKELLTSRKIKNLVDYMIGVEAGLDSNGRKNRGGKTMENIVEAFVQDLCDKNGYRYLKEANSKIIAEKFSYDVPVDKSSRRYDFVVDSGNELIIIETNFYGGGGTKLKSTAGEYRSLFDLLSGKYKFVWITDGLGWKSTALPLRETFDHNEYIFNLNMLEKNILGLLLES